MNEDKDGEIHDLGADDVELKRFAEQGHKLKWTWIIGILVIIVCLMIGETAERLLAFLVACYIAFATFYYFKSVSTRIS